MKNPIDLRKESIKAEVTAKVRDYTDPDVQNYEIIDALAFRCAVAESKLEADRDLEEEKRVRW